MKIISCTTHKTNEQRNTNTTTFKNHKQNSETHAPKFILLTSDNDIYFALKHKSCVK